MQAVIAHTEDGCPEWKDYGYVVNAHIKPTERNGYIEERFLAFCYPGEQNKIGKLFFKIFGGHTIFMWGH